VAIRNDSPFPLHVQVMGADGRLLGAISLNPEEQKSWNDPDLVENNTPTVPYTVIFYCLEGSEYGILTNVPVGAMVQASTVEGKRICKPQTKKTIKEEKEAHKDNPNLQDVNEHQWRTNQIN
jgi:hypothetical protein